MNRELTLTQCTKCGKTGVLPDNGNVPAGWRREVQDQLLCPVCWGPSTNNVNSSHRCFRGCGTWLDNNDRDANGTKHDCIDWVVSV